MRSRYVLAVCVLCSALPSFAQQAQSAQSAPVKPYIIEFEQKREQTLADGTHIVQISHTKRYRDSQGRTRIDYVQNSETGDFPHTNVMVYDANGRFAMSWMIGDHMESSYTTGTMPGNSDSAVAHQSIPSATQSHAQLQRTTEQLGVQEVQGFPCAASRATVVYPVGMIGNDKPITNVTEHCVSGEFKLTLRDRTIDPRGSISLTAISISRQEPDASVFQPPAGFVERKTVIASPPAAH